MSRHQKIHDVRIVLKRKIKDDRGAVYHMLSVKDPEFSGFGEIYLSQVNPNVVKAWNVHSRMIRNYLLVCGSAHLVLFDDRSESPTRGALQEIRLDERSETNQLVIIPPGIWSGFKGVGSQASIIANCASIAHDPTEISRRSFDDPYFSYDWSLVPQA